MSIAVVSKRFAVAPQLAPGDLAAAAGAGYRVLICNRPDGEEAGQPDAAAMRAAATEAGMEFHHIPVSGGAFPDEAIAAFGALRRTAPGKVLAYCRSGTRSITLDALANPEGLDPATLIATAKAAGYDLSALAPRLNAQNG